MDVADLSVNTIRTLSIDAVQAANSGHPGAPMGLAPVAYTIWQEALRYDPANPTWWNRDRFVLSCGHASALLYSILHLAGVKDSISLEHLKQFRQLGSPCAGHPEYGQAAGIEMTTGPLGQGVATSVGMAIASRWLGARYNREGLPLFDFRVIALCSDGDLMEGVSAEAASMAGHLKLANLCWVYDNNGITIDGSTDLAFTEDVGARFQAMGWRVLRVADANDRTALAAALQEFRNTTEAPTLVIVDSQIAFGAPTKAGTAGSHGSPLGPEEVAGAKRNYGWPEDAPAFHVPDEVRADFQNGVGKRGADAHAAWLALWECYQQEHPAEAGELKTMYQIRNRLPGGWDADIPEFPADEKGPATRQASGQVLNAIASKVPWLVGGSADLTPSNNTNLKDGGTFSADNPGGRNFHFGIREHAMGSALNGMALCGLRPFGATFAVFSDYCRPAIRLAALMGQPSLFIFTHDSISLGEDGPTHQPIEHLASLRAIPNLIVIRPADANEVARAYFVAMQMENLPVALLLTRQGLPVLDRGEGSEFAKAKVELGAYVLADNTPAGELPEAILMASGSEVPLCVQAWRALTGEGRNVRLVSMPSWELFESAGPAHRDAVLPPEVTARVAVEMGASLGWERWVGPQGRVLGIDRFGASGPYRELEAHFGFTPENVAAAVRDLL